ncbi:MAG: hypothetical protein M3065_06480, partial [Actinomycetota bacterium]|nr:hypothetical protein [Actinomycetota bacterium]
MSTRSPSRAGGSGDVVLLSVIGAVLALAALAWLWGGLAGLVFGDGWPRLSIGQDLGVLVKLPGSLTHPALAWPAAARSRLPGPAGFYAALGAVVAGCAGLAIAVARAAGGRVFGGGGSASGARWARGRELAVLR